MVDLLKGIRIVSFTHFLFGPMGVQALTDLGADVITIEPFRGSWQRGWGGEDNKMVDGQSVLFLSVDRNKRSIAIDLQMETFICYLNGPRPGSVLPPNWIAGWHYAAPHKIYAASDGHLAISMASLKTLGEVYHRLRCQPMKKLTATRSERRSLPAWRRSWLPSPQQSGHRFPMSTISGMPRLRTMRR